MSLLRAVFQGKCRTSSARRDLRVQAAPRDGSRVTVRGMTARETRVRVVVVPPCPQGRRSGPLLAVKKAIPVQWRPSGRKGYR